MDEEINKFLVDPSAQSPFVRWGSYENDTHVLTLKLCVPVEEIPSHLSPVLALIRKNSNNNGSATITTDEKTKAGGGSHDTRNDVDCPPSSSYVSFSHSKTATIIPIEAIIRFEYVAKDSASSANSNSAATTRNNTKASAAPHSPLTAIRGKASAAGSGSGAGERERSATRCGSPKHMITASLVAHSPFPSIGKASDFFASAVPTCTCTPLTSGPSQLSHVDGREEASSSECQICASTSDVDLMHADFPPTELSSFEEHDACSSEENKNKAIASTTSSTSTCSSALFTTDATHFTDIIRWAEAHCMAEAQRALACRVALLEEAYSDYYYRVTHFEQQQQANTSNIGESSGEGETERKSTERKTPATYLSDGKDEETVKVQRRTAPHACSPVGNGKSEEESTGEGEGEGGMGWRAGTCEMGDPIFSSGAYMHTYSSQSHTEEYHHSIESAEKEEGRVGVLEAPLSSSARESKKSPSRTRDNPFLNMHRELAAIIQGIHSNPQLTDVSTFTSEQILSHFSVPYSLSTCTGTSASGASARNCTVAYKIQDDVLRKTLTITVLYDYSRKLTPLTCEAWNLEQPIKSQTPTTGELSEATEPLQIIFKFNRERFLSQPVEVVVGQKRHFSSGVFLGAAGHIRNVMDNLMKYASRRPQQPVVSSSRSSLPPPSRTLSPKGPTAIIGKDDDDGHDEVALYRQRYYNEFDVNNKNIAQTAAHKQQCTQGRWQGAVAEVYKVIRAEEESKNGAIGGSDDDDDCDDEDGDGTDNSTPPTDSTPRRRSSGKAVLKQQLCDAEESFDLVSAVVTYFDLRIDSLTHFCAICDKKHATTNNDNNISTAASSQGNAKKSRLSHLVRSAVCTRSLCSFRFQSLGVGRNAAAALSLHPVVADALIAFTRCAIRTIRWDSILLPFPMLFGKNGELVIGEGLDEEEKSSQAAGAENQATNTNSKTALQNDLKSGPHRAKRQKDITKLRALVEHLPSTTAILQGNWDNNAFGCHQQSEEDRILTRNLINWIFSSCTSYIKLLDGQPIKFMEAAHQFVFIQSTQRHARAFEEMKARTLAQGKRTLWAFHGSRHENWHSIIRNGLVNASGTALQVNGAAYGSGIYLSPHASVSYSYSGMSNYDKPLKGLMKPAEPINRDGYHCIAICEVIDEDLNKTASNTIWIQPHSSHVMTRFFFVFNRDNICGSKSLVLTDPAIAEQLDRALTL